MPGKNNTVGKEGSGSLPPLSTNDFRAYNRLSEQMDGFVSYTFTNILAKNKFS